jgi:hypothetical protein
MWEVYPYKFRIDPIYVLTITALVNIAFVAILIYHFSRCQLWEPYRCGWNHLRNDTDLRRSMVFPLDPPLEESEDFKLAWKELPPA